MLTKISVYSMMQYTTIQKEYQLMCDIDILSIVIIFLLPICSYLNVCSREISHLFLECILKEKNLKSKNKYF
jgi:hypothetical protein